MYGTVGIVFWIGIFIIFYRVLFYFQSVQDFGRHLSHEANVDAHYDFFYAFAL